MATATKERKPKATKPAAVATDNTALDDEIEYNRIVIKAAKENDAVLTPGEHAHRRKMLSSDRRKADRKWQQDKGRYKLRYELQRQAGPAATRLEHRQEHERRLKALDEQRAESQIVIKAEQDKVAKAEEAARELEEVVAREEVAENELQNDKMFSQYELDEMGSKDAAWKSGEGHRLESARTDRSVLQSLLKLDVSERRSTRGGLAGGKDLDRVRCYIESHESFGPNATSRLDAFGMIRERTEGHWHNREVVIDNLDRKKWEAYLRAEVEPKIAELSEEIEQLEKLEAEHFEEIEQLRSRHVPK